MTNSTSVKPPHRFSWRRALGVMAGCLVVVLVVFYFVVTSSAYFKGVILPRVSREIGGEVTVKDASFSPFSHLILRGLTVKTTGAEPLLQAEEVRLRYNLFATMGGTLTVKEATIDSPVVQIVENPDGTSNLDPLEKNKAKPETQPPPSAEARKPAKMDVQNVALKNATIRETKTLKDGQRQTVEISGVNISLDQLKNGQPGKLAVAAAYKMTGPSNDVLEAKCNGDSEFTLGPDLVPTTLKVNIAQDILKAEGSFSNLSGDRTVLAGEVTPTEVKDLGERFYHEDQLLGEIKANGPLDLAKKEGRVKLEVASIDHKLLNLMGAPKGIDFGSTTVNSVIELALSHGGSVIAVNGQFNAGKFSVAQKGQATPPVDLTMACDLTVNTEDKSAVVQTLTIDGKQEQRQFLHGNLTQPMAVAWGNAAAAPANSAFELAVTDFNLAQWRPIIGNAISGGDLSLKLNLTSQQGGKQLNLDVVSQIANLAANLGKTALTQAALGLKMNAQVGDFKKVDLTDYRLDLTNQGQSALTVSGAATYDGTALDLHSQVETVPARLLGSGPSTPLTVGVKLNGTFTNQLLDLRQLQLALSPTRRAPTNTLDFSGQLDLTDRSMMKGQLMAKAETLDLTQLYDAFAGQTNAAAAQPAAPAPENAGNAEPEAVKLPLQCTADADLAQVWLREVSIQNCRVTAKVDGGKILLDPCRLMLNGAPASARVDLNLGVKGYTYALTCNMDRVPLEPIADTFEPSKKGQYKGLILANAQINGAGVRGTELRKNLGGQAEVNCTNATIQLVTGKLGKMIAPIETVLRVPNLTQSPVNWVDAKTELGDGKINLSRCVVRSDVFRAKTHGAIPIADVLSNSPLNLPIEFALKRAEAQKADLLAANTPPDAPYAGLPTFVTVRGTLGEPKSDIDKMALGQMLLKSGVGSRIPKPGNLLPGGNQSGTNTTPKNPLNLFK